MRSLALALCLASVLPMVSGCGRRRPPVVSEGDRWVGSRAEVGPGPAGEERVGLACFGGLLWHPEFGCLAEASNLDVWHRDRMGSGFVLLSADYSVDGELAARFTAPPNDEPGDKDISIGRLRLDQREHQVALKATFRGNGAGVFAYLQGYRFEVRASHAFAQGPSRQVLSVFAFDKGGASTPIEDRPGVRFELVLGGLR